MPGRLPDRSPLGELTDTVRRGRVLTMAVPPVISLMLSSCTGPLACSGAASYPPSVWFNGAGWASAHPGSLRVCTDSTCKTFSTGDLAATQQLVISNDDKGHGRAAVTLRISGKDGTNIDVVQPLTLHYIVEHSACGGRNQWQADISLSSNGRTTVTNGETRPGPFFPTPSASH